MSTRREVLAGLGTAASVAACGPFGGSETASERLGIAVVGLGALTTGQVLPAIASSRLCRVSGLVSGTRDKLDEYGRRYDVPAEARLLYENFDHIARNPRIHAVYIALPNAMHADFAIRAARAGKHVLCEKPMAVSSEECQRMINAHRESGTRLSIAYRLRHAPHHAELTRLARDRQFGNTRLIDAGIGFPVAGPGDWRLSQRMAGGGALIEMGVYAIQACRNLAGAEPVEVTAFESRPADGAFREVEPTMIWSARYPGGVLAHCAASYVSPMNRLWMGAESGFAELDPAFDYGPLKGRSSDGTLRARDVNHFEAQCDAFAECIRKGAPMTVSGEEGLQDLRIVEAIYRSARERRTISL